MWILWKFSQSMKKGSNFQFQREFSESKKQVTAENVTTKVIIVFVASLEQVSEARKSCLSQLINYIATIQRRRLGLGCGKVFTVGRKQFVERQLVHVICHPNPQPPLPTPSTYAPESDASLSTTN